MYLHHNHSAKCPLLTDGHKGAPMRTDRQSLYEVIGLPQDASRDHIEKRCVLLGERYRPDRNTGDLRAALTFAQIEQAYATLVDPVKRAAYDAELRSKATTQGDAAIVGTVSTAATNGPTLTGAASGRGDIGFYSNMNNANWLLVFFVTVDIQATKSDFLFALGYSIPWFVAGMVFSPIWWGVTKKGRIAPWQWFDWLNAGAYITVGLLILSVFVKSWVRTQVGG